MIVHRTETFEAGCVSLATGARMLVARLDTSVQVWRLGSVSPSTDNVPDRGRLEHGTQTHVLTINVKVFLQFELIFEV
jgi:hypothetical protein